MDVMEQPGSSAGSEPLISIERKITCPTYCNRLHVTQTMALQLLPRVSEAQMKVGIGLFYQCDKAAAERSTFCVWTYTISPVNKLCPLWVCFAVLCGEECLVAQATFWSCYEVGTAH